MPVMVHIGTAPPALDEVLDLLRPGDIVTHCASGLRRCRLGPAAHAAYDRGCAVRHRSRLGRRSPSTRPSGNSRRDSGRTPISTDLHARSVCGPVFDLPTTMAKLLAVGLSAGRGGGGRDRAPGPRPRSDRPGRWPSGRPPTSPCSGSRRARSRWSTPTGRRGVAPLRLVNEGTYVGGRRLTPATARAAPAVDPVDRRPARRPAAAARHDVRALLATPLVGVDGLAEQFPRNPILRSRSPDAQARRAHRQGRPRRRSVLAGRRGRRHRLPGRRDPGAAGRHPGHRQLRRAGARRVQNLAAVRRGGRRAAWTRPSGSASTCATSPTSRR